MASEEVRAHNMPPAVKENGKGNHTLSLSLDHGSNNSFGRGRRVTTELFFLSKTATILARQQPSDALEATHTQFTETF